MAAPTDISATVTLSVLGGLRWAPTTGASVVQRIAEAFNLIFSQGTGSDQIQLAYCERRTGTAGAEQIDLDSSTLTAKDGTGLTFSSIRAFGIINETTGSDIMTLGGVFVVSLAASEVMTGTPGSTLVYIRPGGIVFFSSPRTGYACSGATRDKLTITTTSTHPYTLFVLGLD